MTANDPDKLTVLEGERDEFVPVVTHLCEAANLKAKIATEMAERWGPVAAVEDGEDSAGRQKLRRLTAAELAEHACNCASELVESFRARGWMTPLPTPRRKVEHPSEDT